MPALVYISQPTESGTLYSLSELEAISGACREKGIRLYLDGARLAYALSSSENTASLSDIASLCDAFYIGGTKCGALFGEALVIPKGGLVPHLFTIIKQRGALLAKGRIAALQFDTFFTDNLYFKLGKRANEEAALIKEALAEKGYDLAFNSPTNQIFVILDKKQIERLQSKVLLGFWEELDGGRTIMRICTSWATKREDVLRLIDLL